MTKILSTETDGIHEISQVGKANGGFGQAVDAGLINDQVAIVSGNAITIGNLTSAAIPTTTVSAASYPSTGQIPTFTVGTDGRLTAAGSTMNATGLILNSNSTFSNTGSVNLTGNNGFASVAQGKYVYTTDLSSSVMNIVDVTNPAAPAAVGSVTLAGQLRSIAVQGNYAYVTSNSNGLYVVDISNPSSPSSSGSVAIVDPRAVVVSGKYAYVFSSNGVSSTIKTVDISVSSSPTIVGSVAVDNDLCTTMSLQRRYLYVTSTTNSTVSIYDVSTPTSLTRTNTPLNVGIACIGIRVSGKYAYACNTSGSVAVIDVSNPASPSLVSTFSSGSGSGGLYLYGRYLFLADSSNNRVRIIDISNPSSLSQITTMSIVSSSSSFAGPVVGRYMYILYATTPSSLKVYDLGGTEATTIKVGNLSSGAIQATESLDVVGSTTIGSGLYVGNEGILSEGPITSKVTANILQSGSVNLSADQTTTSASLGDITGSTFTITTSISSKLKIYVSYSMSNTTAAGSINRIALLIDGSVVKNSTFSTPAIANQYGTGAIVHQASLSAGSHTVKLQWSTSAGTLQCRPVTSAINNEHVTLDYMELSK